MRALAKTIGYSGAAVTVIVAGQYAWSTSDNPVTGAIWAFLYGFISVGGLFGPALAARVWRSNRSASAFVWLVAMASLTVAISNEIGAMAGRGSEQTARRTGIAETVQDMRRSLALAEAERASLRFAPADDAAVQAAKAKAAAATQAKDAECTYRGARCREKEVAESQALADLATVTGNKALTDRAITLDARIADLREKIANAGPVRETNTQGRALSRLFGLDEAEAGKLLTWQNTAMTIVVELLIVALILAGEEIGKHKGAPASRNPEERQSIAASEPAALPSLSRPRLVASEAVPVGSVVQIVHGLIEPGTARNRLGVIDLYKAYAAACAAAGKRPVSPSEFPAALAPICEACGIAIRDEGSAGIFLLKVRLKRIANAG